MTVFETVIFEFIFITSQKGQEVIPKLDESNVRYYFPNEGPYSFATKLHLVILCDFLTFVLSQSDYLLFSTKSLEQVCTNTKSKRLLWCRFV